MMFKWTRSQSNASLAYNEVRITEISEQLSRVKQKKSCRMLRIIYSKCEHCVVGLWNIPVPVAVLATFYHLCRRLLEDMESRARSGQRQLRTSTSEATVKGTSRSNQISSIFGWNQWTKRWGRENRCRTYRHHHHNLHDCHSLRNQTLGTRRQTMDHRKVRWEMKGLIAD